MYKNRIRHATPKLSPNSHPKFFIRRSDIAFEKRVRYIESVCQVLIESRFGPGRVEPVVISFTDRPELEPAVFYDPCDGSPTGLVPCYSLSPHGRKGYQVIEAAYRRAKQMGLVDAAPTTHNPTSTLTPNQGRGSPNCPSPRVSKGDTLKLDVSPLTNARVPEYAPGQPQNSGTQKFFPVATDDEQPATTQHDI